MSLKVMLCIFYVYMPVCSGFSSDPCLTILAGEMLLALLQGKKVLGFMRLYRTCTLLWEINRMPGTQNHTDPHALCTTTISGASKHESTHCRSFLLLSFRLSAHSLPFLMSLSFSICKFVCDLWCQVVGSTSEAESHRASKEQAPSLSSKKANDLGTIPKHN